MFEEKSKMRYIFLSFLLILFIGCTKDDFKWSLDKIPPKVNTLIPTEITAYTGILNGKVLHDGGLRIIEKGFCIGPNPDPDVQNNQKIIVGTSKGEYSANIDHLTESTNYFIRAYAINEKGVSYGATHLLKTLTIGKVETIGSSEISSTSSKMHGKIISSEGESIQKFGFLVNEVSNFNTGNIEFAGSAISGNDFTVSASGLKSNTKYYFRAYIQTKAGIGHGDIKEFTTISPVFPSVTTNTATLLSASSAQITGNVTNQGSSAVYIRGICYSKNPQPTINSSVQNSGAGLGTYSCNITNLDPGGITYYFRAFATNNEGTGYGNQTTITTGSCKPALNTAEVTNITSNSATTGGSIVSDGGYGITAKGVVWSTATYPSVSLSTKTNHGSGSSSFVSNITGLSPNTKYYVRAYATNSCGTEYGTQKSFTTATSGFIGTIVIGTNTLVESATSYPNVTPFGTYFENARHIYLIRASEIKNLGGGAGKITKLSFNVVSAADITVNNFNVKYGTTNQSSLSLTNTYNFSYSDLYNPFNLRDIMGNGTGWLSLTFINPIIWDGQSNLIFEVCFSNTRFEKNTTVYYSDSGFYSNLAAADDYGQGCSLPFDKVITNRPNLRLTFE